MKINDICDQLEDLASELVPEDHKESCEYLKLIRTGHPPGWPIFPNDGSVRSPSSLCTCNIGKHIHNILFLKTKLQDALELLGIEPHCRLAKHYKKEK